jgi:bifunctional pyridoxal-dependent enzyme with beta-cystathionase and maltose regulon repressor activities
MFLWLDLSAHLPLAECDGDGWAAQRLLSKRFLEAGITMCNGEYYHAPNPGRFRLVFSVEKEALKEGIRRLTFPFLLTVRNNNDMSLQNLESFGPVNLHGTFDGI